MKGWIQFKITILPLLTGFVLGFALAPNAQAVFPPPDGGYPGGNTAEGQAALLSLTTGGFNTAVGYLALRNNTGGGFNTAMGAGALLANFGADNTATGAGALLSNSTGVNNTANGVLALFHNTTGQSNTAIGSGALLSNTTSNNNTAIGFHALWVNTDGGSNTATGFNALAGNTSGDNNTAIGFGALASNITGAGNTAIGDGALFNSSGTNNTALGATAGAMITTANNVICIGTQGADVSTSCFIGHIRGITTGNADAIPVLIDSAEQLSTMSSSRRFKDDINPMEKASEAILALKPVKFRYKGDTTGTTQFGLIAEEVADVNPDLIVRDAKGEIYTARYEAMNAMLLNEFLKEHRTVQELKTAMVQQQKQIEALTAGLQKVRAELELNKSAPQTVLNDQ